MEIIGEGVLLVSSIHDFREGLMMIAAGYI
jgi:hypothetical protein